ncbi:DNA polymerase III subunit alpha [uncultured Caudovirales phage]|uniref:DNA polymerase III subunit alpha n=1 Tax=uncultured Caudovirales phage TaxID=2100421 RepID=A0A6J5L270_9CAUD|nr:DNA polymerase III subunit alpha [uncultured Caudovirales phage]
MAKFRNCPTPHSHPQSFDSGSTPLAFANREIELGTGTLTVTDHGTMGACRAIYDLAKVKKLTPIIGMEAYFRDDNCEILKRFGIDKPAEYLKYYHLTIHCLDEAAFEKLSFKLSYARTERHGSEVKPLFNWADLEEIGAHNVTITSGCLVGMVQRHILRDGLPMETRLAISTAYYERLKALTKPGNWYVELFPHRCDRNWVHGVFLTTAGGDKLKFWDRKKLKTTSGEYEAAELAKNFGTKKWKEGDSLIAVMNNRKWEDRDPIAIQEIVRVEDFMPNECQPWCPDGDVQLGCNNIVAEMARKHGDLCIVSDDSHFATPEEKIVQDVRLSQMGNWKFSSSYHRQSSDESFEYFKTHMDMSESQFEAMVETNIEWASKFKSFAFTTKPTLPANFYPEDTLAHFVSLVKKHGRLDTSKPEYVKRLQDEIKLLHKNGTIDLLPYFALGEEVTSFYEKIGMLCGPGRGSASGLLTTYLLGITHVDPLKHELSMNRFLTKDRINSGKLPDIDQDLPTREPLTEPNGLLETRFKGHYAQIGTDTTLKLKSSAKDVARMLYGEVPEIIENLTKRFVMPPQGVSDKDFVFGYEDSGNWQTGSIETDEALKEYIRLFPKDWEIVQKCLGLARSRGRHASGFAITHRPIAEFIPLMTMDENIVTQYTAASVEAAGAIKMDFLVVNVLRDIQDAVRIVQERSGMEIPDELRSVGFRTPKVRILPFEGKMFDVWGLPENQEVFHDICEGRTETVFQFSTEGARQWLTHFNHWKEQSENRKSIDSIDAMAAFTALDRPGPLDAYVEKPDGTKHNMLVEYANRARGEEAVGTLPIFQQMLPDTHGILAFQEQLEKMYQTLTECSGAEAEEFRSNAAKKKMDKILQKYKPWMEKVSLKYGEKEANNIWNFMVSWAQYGFNKSMTTTTELITVQGIKKNIIDFKAGEQIASVDESGNEIISDVVAVHDHGQLMGWEVEFDDGYKVVVSHQHKFLTDFGQKPLHEIVDHDLGVLCGKPAEQRLEVPVRDSLSVASQTGSAQVGLSTVDSEPSTVQGPMRGACACKGLVAAQVGLPKMLEAQAGHSGRPTLETEWSLGTGHALRCRCCSEQDQGTQEGMCNLQGDQEGAHSGKNGCPQSSTGTEGCFFQGCKEDLCSQRNSIGARCSNAHLAKEQSRGICCEHAEGTKSGQEVKDGSMVAQFGESDLGGIVHPVWGEAEASGFCVTRSKSLGRSGRILPLLLDDGRRTTVSDSAGTGQDAERGSTASGGRDIDSSFNAMLPFWRSHEGLVAGVVHSDAPLTSTGSLVRRRIVRVTAVGLVPMCDLEVSTPKHNFMLPNGAITSNSHSVSYCYIAYACAFLKHYYPLEWWTAVLRNSSKKDIDEKYWKYAGSMIRLPDIAKSKENFEIVDGMIQSPISMLHGIGEIAHNQLMALRPFANIQEFTDKIEKFCVDATKPVLDADGNQVMVEKGPKGKKVSTPKVKRGTCAVNRGVVYDLIVSGVFDSLFDTETHEMDKLHAYEAASAKSKGKKKVEAVNPKYLDLTAFSRYQTRKGILPPYSDSLLKMMIATKTPNVSLRMKDGTPVASYRYGAKDLRFVSLPQMEQLNVVDPFPEGDKIWVALAAYVIDQRVFSYKGGKQACEFEIDVVGNRLKLVKWPNQQGSIPAVFKTKLKGAIVVALLSKYREDRPFALEDIVVVQPPLGENVEVEETEE